MQIKERFQCDGKNCYKIEDNTGMETFLTYRGLYAVEYLDQMKADGYKILDYHGHIVTPEGMSIEDIALSDNTLSVAEIDAMEGLDDFAVSESEATSYFSRDFKQVVVELRQSENKIKTREELIKYLINYNKAIRNNLAIEDCLPLNSFVSQDALFTLEEIQTDSQVSYYMDIVAKRRELRSYEAYKKLIRFLQDEGVLGENYTADDVKRAYLSWGVCGVKSMFTKLEDKAGIKTNIFMHGNDASYKGGRMHKNLLCPTGEIISLSGKVPAMLTDEECNESEIQPAEYRQYLVNYRDSNKWTTNYKCIECWEPNYRTRTVGSMIDDSGVSYTMLLDTDTIVIRTNSGNVIIQPYLKIKTYNEVKLPIDYILTEKEYDDWCKCSAKAHDIVESKTLHSDVESTYELLSKEGLPDKDIIQYMARRINENPDLNNLFDATLDLSSAEELYSGEIPQHYIKKYNPNDLPYDTRNELIDIMIETKADLEAQNKYLVIDETSAIAKFQSQEEAKLRPVEQLEFARDVLNGRVNIDHLARGKQLDGNVEYIQLVEFLKLCYNVFGNGKSLDEFLLHITESKDDIDLDTVFTVRDSAYWGAVRDTAELNAMRARECVNAIYVDHVYREISREPAEKQRHYAFDCISLKLDSKKTNISVKLQNKLTEIITEAVKKMPIHYILKEALCTEANHIALKLMFRAAYDNTLEVVQNTSDSNMVDIKFKHKIREEVVDFNLAVSRDVFMEMLSKVNYSVEYCKLSDWCRFSFLYGAPKLYCLNANITPWEVIPKEGVLLKSYNFPINYISEKVYNESIPEAVRLACNEVEGKVSVLRKNPMLIRDDPAALDVVYTLENSEMYLQNMNFAESMDKYYDRFILSDREAKKNGKLVYKIRNKSDIFFKSYANNYSSKYISDDEDVYIDFSEDLSRAWFSSVDVLELGQSIKTNQIEMGKNRIDRFDINTEAFTDVLRWPELLKGSFNLKDTVVVAMGTKVMIVTQKGSLTRDLQSISIEDCQALVEKGIFYQLSAREFLVRTTSYDFKVEVY